MPIDWKWISEPSTVGEELVELMRELFPLPRSLTGSGVRDALGVLSCGTVRLRSSVPENGQPVWHLYVGRKHETTDVRKPALILTCSRPSQVVPFG
jgi:aminopeptidase-like protein